MRVVPVSQRIDIRVTAGQEDSIEISNRFAQKTGVRNQRNVHRQTAGGFNCFAVMTGKIEPVSCQLDAHRDADARPCSCCHSFAVQLSIERLFANAIIAQMPSLTKLRRHSYSAVSLHDERTIPENPQYDCFARAS